MPTWATTRPFLGSAELLPNGEPGLHVRGSRASVPIRAGQSIEVLPNGTRLYVQQMSEYEYRSYFVEQPLWLHDVAPAPPPMSSTPGLKTRSWGRAGRPTNMIRRARSWSFSGTAGVAGNGSVFTAATPTARRASQVGFLQATGTMSQAVNFAVAGTYQISVSAAQRGNFGTSDEEVQVQVDGTVVDTFTPSGTHYATYTTASFNLTAGSHTITFVGVDPTKADYTAFLDQVSINNVARRGLLIPVLRTRSKGQAGRPTRMIRQARRGASAARPAWRATAAASPPATPSPHKAARSPSSRRPARSARW